jgi:thiosulfate dehydrogenase [quinone] large subunit
MNEQSPSWGLVLIRLVAGMILLVSGWSKLSSGVGEEYVQATASAWSEAPSMARAWGEAVVLKHPWFFAQLVCFGELLIGIGLFLGAFVRPLGYAGAFLFLNGLFVVPDAQLPQCWLLLGVCLGCAMSGAGTRAGADVFLNERAPSWLTWSRGG